MRTRMIGALGAIALIAAGCGSSDDYDNASRPAAPINVSVSLTNDRVRVSPDRVGAGPVVLIVANTSDKSHSLTLTPAGGAGSSCIEGDASSGPINPQGTAHLAVELVEGSCVVGVEGARLRTARLTVGPRRPSSQQELLQP